MQPRLAAMTFEADDHIVFQGISDLQDEEYRSLIESVSELGRFEAGQLLFEICRDNFMDIIDFTNEVILRLQKKSLKTQLL